MENYLVQGYTKEKMQMKAEGYKRVSRARRRWYFENRLSRYAKAALDYIGLVASGKIVVTQANLVTHHERFRACKYVLDQHLGKPGERVIESQDGETVRIREIEIVKAAEPVIGEIKDVEVKELGVGDSNEETNDDGENECETVESE